jgi:alkaline phosphatase
MNKHTLARLILFLLLTLTIRPQLFAQFGPPSMRIVLPERTRLLQGQLIDLVLEIRNASSISGLRVTASRMDLTGRFAAPQPAQLDCDASPDLVVRANLQSFDAPGSIVLQAEATANGTTISDSRTIEVRPFSINGRQRNVILFIGDAMGTAYRDAARLVSKAVLDSNGRKAFREGFFDDVLQMDKMPVTGMVTTYGSDSVVPDSANSGTAWASGNKSYLNAVNVFGDGTDCRWRFNGAANAANLAYILDNPRVENLWQYLKRRYGYRTGIVTTADVTDATPAVEGAYSGFRQTRFEIARQYVENPMLGGRPAFDVILGGGMDQFVPTARTDHRNLIQEFTNLGYQLVTTAGQLNNVSPALSGGGLLGLFKGNAVPAANSTGLAASDSNMDVAYDKLRLPRPASEPLPNFGNFPDQPMLDRMTSKAIEFLSQSSNRGLGAPSAPFILMVEAASIDKQSHPNNAAGTIWDAIELDRAVGVARQWAGQRSDTLVLVTGDHDQSMSIIGVNNVPDVEYFDRGKKLSFSITSARGNHGFSVFGDSYANTRASLPFINSSDSTANRSGVNGMPGSFPDTTSAANPYADTYSTYFGFPAYPMDPATGYPLNSAQPGQTLRRLAVGFRTGDHTGSSVPITAEGPGAFLFTGYMDQTDVFFKVAIALSGDTEEGDALLRAISKKYPKPIGQ